MTKIKLCGITRICDIDAINEFKPDYIGFIFASKSRRYITAEKAAKLKKRLNNNILAVGVFVNEKIDVIENIVNNGIIDAIQLHGYEDENYIKKVRELTDKTIIKAFSINDNQDVLSAEKSSADYILFDSGKGGTGTNFDWKLVKNVKRNYFIAGGLDYNNVKNVIEILNPYAVDVSSGIETNGIKDKNKMYEFIRNVRNL